VLLGWPPVCAIAVLVLNDHVLKGRAPGLITGKLSDAAGLFVFPLLIFAALDSMPTTWRPGRRTLAGAIVTTTCVFAAAKLGRAGALAYGAALGSLRGVGHVFSSRPVDVVSDPTDLAALPFAVAAWFYGKRFAGKPGS
jgi:hypothetical protein